MPRQSGLDSTQRRETRSEPTLDPLEALEALEQLVRVTAPLASEQEIREQCLGAMARRLAASGAALFLVPDSPEDATPETAGTWGHVALASARSLAARTI